MIKIHYLICVAICLLAVTGLGKDAPVVIPKLTPEVITDLQKRYGSKVENLPSSPVLRKRVNPVPPFPEKGKHMQDGMAGFILVVGRDGKVAELYLQRSSDESFAVSGYEALIKWVFPPADQERLCAMTFIYRYLDDGSISVLFNPPRGK